MSPMLIGIGAVILVIILAGVFFMSKRRPTAGSSPATLANRPKTLAEQQQEIERQRQQSATVTQPPSASTVTTAEQPLAATQHLSAQDDTKSAVPLKNEAPAVNQPAHQSTSAMNVAAPVATVVTTAAAAQTADSIDFDFFDNAEENLNQSPTAAKAVSSASTAHDDLDFDLAFDEPKLTSSLSNTAHVTDSQPTLSDHKTDNDINFEFDVPAASTAAPTSKEVVLQDGGELSFDDFASDEFASLDLDKALTTETSASKPNNPLINEPVTATDDTALLTEDFDFNFDAPSTSPAKLETGSETASSTSTISQTVTTQASDKDFALESFDFGEPTTAPTTKTNQTSSTQPAAASDDFDLGDFDFTEPESSSLPVTKRSEAVINTPATDLSKDIDLDFSFDAPTESPATQTQHSVQTPTLSEPVVNEDLTFDEFDIDVDHQPAIQASPATEVNQPTASISGKKDEFTDFDFSDELTVDNPTEAVAAKAISLNVTQPTSSDLVFNDDLNVADDLTNQAVTQIDTASPTTPETTTQGLTDVQPTATAPVAAEIPQGLSNAFDLLKDIDSTQLNIELAEQYLNLGEYNSAKRLLDEVSVTDNPHYQEKIQQLLEKIG